ncbi:MAG TPA: peptidoglycan editing factor PgeF [Gammaproteobacteria bacterium]|nr:peptidoglycan editing factor PgeF [Gammaproteobacteria bacterium]
MNGYLIPDWKTPANIRAYTVLRPSSHTLVLPSEPVWLNQIHTSNIVEASTGRNSSADASYTSQPNIICTIRTADCLPLLITDKQGSVVAAIHAGWKSIAKDIIELTIEKLNKKPDDLLIWLGPAISSQYYEVGEDMKEYFLEYPEGFSAIPNKPGKYLADLYKLARARLSKLNIGFNNIYGGNFCTYSNPELFHSARRDKDQSGRLVTMIWMS